ncbi:hypothetical protein [Blattabacterium sp. (Periplaneta americana)]|uniref:hypothetical protein n=1 Tax=Blattabacterium sp. (Periplaneta americana) TaxID=367488 RepID=UPI00059B389C|nr:hypothetical protein [Blattabacterium sp. (Periplaneta americana)]
MNFFRRFICFLTGFIIGFMILLYCSPPISYSYHQKILDNNIKRKKIIFEIDEDTIRNCKKKYMNPVFIKSELLKKGKIILKKRLLKTKLYPLISHIEIKDKNRKIIFVIEENLDVIYINKIIFF